MDAELVNPLGGKSFDLSLSNIVKAGGFFAMLGIGGAITKSVMDSGEDTVQDAFSRLEEF